MKPPFNIGLVKVQTHTIFKNKIHDKFFVNCDVFSPISNKQMSNLALVIPFTFVRYTLNKKILSKMHAYMKPLPFDFF